MNNPNRGAALDAYYQVSVHLAKWFQGRRFLEIDWPETRIAYQNEISNLNRGPSIFHMFKCVVSYLIKIQMEICLFASLVQLVNRQINK